LRVLALLARWVSLNVHGCLGGDDLSLGQRVVDDFVRHVRGEFWMTQTNANVLDLSCKSSRKSRGNAAIDVGYEQQPRVRLSLASARYSRTEASVQALTELTDVLQTRRRATDVVEESFDVGTGRKVRR
jgi:hypothetical protein